MIMLKLWRSSKTGGDWPLVVIQVILTTNLSMMSTARMMRRIFVMLRIIMTIVKMVVMEVVNSSMMRVARSRRMKKVTEAKLQNRMFIDKLWQSVVGSS